MPHTYPDLWGAVSPGRASTAGLLDPPLLFGTHEVVGSTPGSATFPCAFCDSMVAPRATAAIAAAIDSADVSISCKEKHSSTYEVAGRRPCALTLQPVNVEDISISYFGGWVNPHREQQTIPQGQTSIPPKYFFMPTAKARPDQAALATSAEARGATHRARPRSPSSCKKNHTTHLSTRTRPRPAEMITTY